MSRAVTQQIHQIRRSKKRAGQMVEMHDNTTLSRQVAGSSEITHDSGASAVIRRLVFSVRPTTRLESIVGSPSHARKGEMSARHLTDRKVMPQLNILQVCVQRGVCGFDAVFTVF
jgi:hypothetical protein